jgi:hypothetical protein
MLSKGPNEPSFGSGHLIMPSPAVLNIICVLGPPLHRLFQRIAAYKHPYRKAVLEGAPILDKRQLLNWAKSQKIFSDSIRSLENGRNVKLPTKSHLAVEKRWRSEDSAVLATGIFNGPVPLNRLWIFSECRGQTL